MKELYFEEIEANERVDSTILSMSETLNTHRPKTDIAPRALIGIPLPMSVQTDSKTWVKSGKVGNHGGVIAKVTFKAYQKQCVALHHAERIRFFKEDERT